MKLNNDILVAKSIIVDRIGPKNALQAFEIAASLAVFVVFCMSGAKLETDMDSYRLKIAEDTSEDTVMLLLRADTIYLNLLAQLAMNELEYEPVQ